ncbi:MAG TPA: hypothetical protein ENJ31_00010 [Anaerolineae bacterium]|nr:hypothetical protein [Anaerolineae bacterium]
MIPRYRLLAERLRTELAKLDQVVRRAEGALERAARQPADQDYFLAAAALDLHGFYSGVERLLELIAQEVDESLPKGPRWHRDLLAQMSLSVPGLRPAVLRPETQTALLTYLEFRHVVRNVYTFNLQPERVAELVRGLRPTFAGVEQDLGTFIAFLVDLSEADRAQG